MGVLILGRQTFPYKSVNVISKYQIIDSVSINTLLRFLLSPSLVHLSFTFSEFIVFCTLTCSTSLILASRVLVCCLHEVLTILCIVDSSIWIRLCNLSQINLYLWQLSFRRLFASNMPWFQKWILLRSRFWCHYYHYIIVTRTPFVYNRMQNYI